MGKLLTLDEAAERLNTGHRFVRRLVAEQHIPYHKLGKHVRIDADDLAAYIASGRIEARTRRQGMATRRGERQGCWRLA